MPIVALMGAFLLVLPFVAASAERGGAYATPAITAYSVALTGYNAVPSQTDIDPLITANGGRANALVVAARSRDLAEELPFGTVIAIDGPTGADSANCGFDSVAPLIGYRVITDTMNARISNTVDILFDTKANYLLNDGRTVNASTLLGSCADVSIRVVGHIDLTHVGNLPKTQAELAALVTKPNLALK